MTADELKTALLEVLRRLDPLEVLEEDPELKALFSTERVKKIAVDVFDCKVRQILMEYFGLITKNE